MLAASVPAFAADEPVPVNGDFERVAADGLPDGWASTIGASVSNDGPVSDLAVVDTPGGTGHCVRLRSSPGTQRWQALRSRVAVSPGSFLTLRLRARSRGIDGTSAQWVNSVAAIFYEDAAGARLGYMATATLSGDTEWAELGAHGIVPSRAASAFVQVFLTTPGELWVDDVSLMSTPLDPWSQAARDAVADGLTWHLRRTYSFLGVEGRAPADALTTDQGALRSAETPAAFEAALVEWLARLRDPHVWVTSNGRVVGPMSSLPPPAWTLRGTLETLAGWEKIAQGRNVLAFRKDATGYLLVASFGMRDDDRQALTTALAGLRDVDRLVIDVRANSGGDENVARTVLAPFADADTPYARQRRRNPASDDPEALVDDGARVLAALPEAERSAARVVVLQGRHCMSSTEGFLLMARALPRVTTMGTSSFGASGNPQPFDVLPGVAVWSSTWRSYDLEGGCIEGVGVPPDVPVEPGPTEEWLARDRVLERALELLDD